MPFNALDIGYGIALPAVLGFVLLVALDRLPPKDLWQRVAAGMVFACTFALAYALLKLSPFSPRAHWHWLPHVTVGAGLVSSAAALGKSPRLRAAIYLVAALAGAYFLVPNREDLYPPRTVQLIGWALLVAGQAWAWDQMDVSRPAPRMSSFVAVATLLCTAVFLALAGSLRFSQMGLAATGAATGLFAAQLLRPADAPITGYGLPVIAANCGLQHIGYLTSFSDVPWYAYVLLAVAPGVFATVALIPRADSDRSPWQAAATCGLVCVIGLGIAVYFSVIAGSEQAW